LFYLTVRAHSGFESLLRNTKGIYRDSARLKHQFNFAEARLISLCFGTVLRLRFIIHRMRSGSDTLLPFRREEKV
jgi:hypothetical protein